MSLAGSSRNLGPVAIELEQNQSCFCLLNEFGNRQIPPEIPPPLLERIVASLAPFSDPRDFLAGDLSMSLHCDCVLRQVGAHNGALPELIGDVGAPSFTEKRPLARTLRFERQSFEW